MIMDEILTKIFSSWMCKEGNVNSTKDIIQWIQYLNKTTKVHITQEDISNQFFWFYDDYNGEILNQKRSFFSLKGCRFFEDNKLILEQPIIIQPEIGYLGIICKEIDGVINFLMQAKIEPGNVNCVQISPTIQATKSNFTRAHGGRLPLYLEYFEKADQYHVIYDQVQSEQSSRFYKKRNRNMLMEVKDDIEIHGNYKWMTLGQIKELMKIDNLVNMDTRTVLSGIPFFALKKENVFDANQMSSYLFHSIVDSEPEKYLPKIFNRINHYKMFHDTSAVMIPLGRLLDWTVDDYGVHCKGKSDFEVRYYNIEIEGREVKQWFQPLVCALEMATFGLLARVNNNKYEYLVKICREVGSFDKIELGPTVWYDGVNNQPSNVVNDVFNKSLNEGNVLLDVVLSEEGGRFYHEQNRNVIAICDKDDIVELPDEYIWVDYGTLNMLQQTCNNVNIQLRNLLSLV